MKRQLNNQQQLQHILNVAKNQSKMTVVKTPKPTPKPEEPKKEQPKIKEEPKPIEKTKLEIPVEPVKLSTTGSEAKPFKK